MITRAVLEEPSSQCRNKKWLKIGDGPETRQSLPHAGDYWEQRNEKAKGERLLGTLLKLFSVSGRQATSQWKSTRDFEERKFSDTAL